MNYFLYLFVIIFCYKLITNVYCLKRIKNLQFHYILYVYRKSNQIEEEKEEVIELFKKANISDFQTPMVQKLDYNQLVSGEVPVFDNLLCFHTDFIIIFKELFASARGVYKRRIKQCFSPIFWIDSILFAPKHLLEYLGLDLTQSIGKLILVFIQLIFWFITTLVTIFSTETKIILKNLLEKFS